MAFRRSSWFAFGVLILALKPLIILANNVHTQVHTNLLPPKGLEASVVKATPNYLSAAKPMTGNGVKGCFNPIAYGADPTGVSDNSAAFTKTYTAACAKNNGTVCIPSGTYNFYAPWLAMCASSHQGYTPDIVGAGKTSTILLNNIGAAIGGGPLLELASPLVVSSFGGSATLIQPGLTGSGGNSFNTGTNHALFNIDQMLGDQALNGKSQLDIQAIFNTNTNTAVEYLVSSDGSATPVAIGCNFTGPNSSWSCKGAIGLALGSDGKLYASINTSVTGWTGPSSLHSASAVGTATTVYAELSYDGANVRLFHGALGAANSTEDAKVAQTGRIKQRTDENLALLVQPQYWGLVNPQNFWQGKVDSIAISTVARCVNDAGCAIPNTKVVGDANTLLLENWGNVSNLPLVRPEYTNGQATDTNTKQSWMAMYNESLGNSSGNQPTIRDFGIGGGTVGIHGNVVSPHIERLNMALGSARPLYGIMLDLISDYSSSIDNVVMSNGVLPIEDSGIDFLTNLSITCGVACIETAGSSIKDALLLPPASTQWGIILSSPESLDDIILDTENGGAFTVIQVSNMNGNRHAGFGITNSAIFSWGVGKAPITLDGNYGRINIATTELAHGTGVTGPFVDVTSGKQTTDASGITFTNNQYDLKAEPTDIAGNSYVSATDNLGAVVKYAVVGGGSTRQTILNGTTSGTAVWSMPGEGSSYKDFIVNLAAYLNNSVTSQTITYPVTFRVNPGSVQTLTGSCAGIRTNATTLTFPNTMGGGSLTGICEVRGY
jgi:hypothetical protein